MKTLHESIMDDDQELDKKVSDAPLDIIKFYISDFAKSKQSSKSILSDRKIDDSDRLLIDILSKLKFIDPKHFFIEFRSFGGLQSTMSIYDDQDKYLNDSYYIMIEKTIIQRQLVYRIHFSEPGITSDYLLDNIKNIVRNITKVLKFKQTTIIKLGLRNYHMYVEE